MGQTAVSTIKVSSVPLIKNSSLGMQENNTDAHIEVE
jgi:hypothetical protein